MDDALFVKEKKNINVKFVIENEGEIFITRVYKWSPEEGLPDSEKIFEDMEVSMECDCVKHENWTHCECEPWFDNGKIVDILRGSGLCDTDRVEIYERDIASFGLWCNPMKSEYVLHKAEVVFAWGTYFLRYVSPWSDYPQEKPLSTFYYEKKSHYVSNIGNIYDRTKVPRNDLKIIGNTCNNISLLKDNDVEKG